MCGKDGGCMGKGHQRRPYSTSREERALRNALAYGKITFKTFMKRYNKLLKEGKITRSGRIVGRDL